MVLLGKLNKETMEEKKTTVDEELSRLSKEMPCTGFSVTLAPDATLEDAKQNGVTILTGMEAFINNGHSLKGLPPEITRTFGKITVFKTRDRK